MHKFVDEIVELIKTNPEGWTPTRNSYRLDGIKSGDIEVTGYGNGRLLPIVDVKHSGLSVKLSYSDKVRLELAVMWWYENCSIEHLKTGV